MSFEIELFGGHANGQTRIVAKLPDTLHVLRPPAVTSVYAPETALDVYRAQDCFRVEELAEWLRPDAVVKPDWRADGVGAVFRYWNSGGSTLALTDATQRTGDR